MKKIILSFAMIIIAMCTVNAQTDSTSNTSVFDPTKKSQLLFIGDYSEIFGLKSLKFFGVVYPYIVGQGQQCQIYATFLDDDGVINIEFSDPSLFDLGSDIRFSMSEEALRSSFAGYISAASNLAVLDQKNLDNQISKTEQQKSITDFDREIEILRLQDKQKREQEYVNSFTAKELKMKKRELMLIDAFGLQPKYIPQAPLTGNSDKIWSGSRKN